MNKIGILSLMAMLLLAVGVSAETTVDTTWNGGGAFGVNFKAGDDAESFFGTSGSLISGEYHAVDSDNNPYGYGVDSVEAKVNANVQNGVIEYGFRRTDAKESMYGEAGQESYTLIGADSAQFAWRSTSNYASLKSSNYGWQSNGQIQAQGNQQIYHSFFIDEEYNEGAEIMFTGNADTTITDMSEDHSGSSYKFGKGCGCYTNAKVDITGSGTFDLNAYADNSIVTDSGITTDGFLNIHAAFNNKFKYDNFALEGN